LRVPERLRRWWRAEKSDAVAKRLESTDGLLLY
jgi:hypothetical protein